MTDASHPSNTPRISAPLQRLKVRSDFLKAAKAASCARTGLVLQARPREAGEPHAPAQDVIRMGFTATKRIGNAVVRNRAKRRLREAARKLLPLYGHPGQDYVLIARPGTLTQDWQALLDDVKRALIRLSPKS
jgi:ribonuclease P protein component